MYSDAANEGKLQVTPILLTMFTIMIMITSQQLLDQLEEFNSLPNFQNMNLREGARGTPTYRPILWFVYMACAVSHTFIWIEARTTRYAKSFHHTVCITLVNCMWVCWLLATVFYVIIIHLSAATCNKDSFIYFSHWYLMLGNTYY